MECSTQRALCRVETQQEVEVWQEEQEERLEAAGSQQQRQEAQNREGEQQEAELLECAPAIHPLSGIARFFVQSVAYACAALPSEFGAIRRVGCDSKQVSFDLCI